MDLPCPEWAEQVKQRWSQLGSGRRKKFSLLTDIDEIFSFAQSVVQQEDLAALSRIAESYSVRKSAEYAAQVREQGNLSFKVKNYTAAALYYSKGVCHAEKNTEQLSLCYANRSAALFHLGLYNKCQEDIQRAFDEGYPSHLKCKLIERRAQSLNRLQNQEIPLKAPLSTHQISQMTMKPDGNKCLAEEVTVQFTPQKGRHLLAAEDTSAGEVVVTDEAFSLVLIPGDGHSIWTNRACEIGTERRYCHHCLCQTLSTVPCQGCSYAQYCGLRCASEAWRQYHCSECPAGSELLAVGVLAHLAVRIALKAGLKEVQQARKSSDAPDVAPFSSDLNEGKSGSSGECLCHLEGSLSKLNIEPKTCFECNEHSKCYHGKSYLGVFSLLPHVAHQTPSLRFLLALTTVALCERLKEVGTPPESWSCQEQEGRNGHWGAEQGSLGSTALRHMMQLRCNAQAVTAIRLKEDSGLAVQSSGEVRVATAVFPILSLLNHSCCPNTSISFSLGLGSDSPVSVSIKSSKDVMAGQELLHCYGPHYSRMEVRERQRLLLEQYFFPCCCEACALELACGKPGPTSLGLKCEQCGSSLQAGVCSQPYCNVNISSVELQRRIQVLRHHIDRALELTENGRVDKALEVLQDATSQADSFLMKTHPMQGELADAAARVCATMGDWRQAAAYLKRSVDAVRSQYGEDSVELGRQLYKLTQLYFNGGDTRSALSVIPAARRLLSLHCNLNCEELLELQQMEECLHRVV